MEIKDPPVDAYLKHQMHRDHALGRMVQAPDASQGTVHTPREIAQQPLLWEHTAQLMQAHAPRLRAFLERAGLYGGAGARPALLLTGAGTSDYVGLSVADVLRARLRTWCFSYPTTRITASPDVFLSSRQPYLMVHFARSGNSPESRAALELGLRRPAGEVRHVVITCNQDGALARMAEAHPERVYLVVLHEACNDKGLAMTSSFSSMVVAAQALGYLGDMSGFYEQIKRTARAGEFVLRAHTDALYALADAPLERAFFLGNHDLLGAATESALKVQELTGGRIVAKSEDTLAFRHGPISAVDERSLVCFYLSASAYTRRYELDVVRQYQDAFRAMGARVVLFGAQHPDVEPREGLTALAYDPEEQWSVPVLEEANLAALIGQLAGVFAAYRRGGNVDSPSAGKTLYNRTVQGVRLYAYPENGSEGAWT